MQYAGENKYQLDVVYLGGLSEHTCQTDIRHFKIGFHENNK